MDLDTLQQDIIKEEGGNILKPYQDHLGFWTIGVGHLIRDTEKEVLNYNQALIYLDKQVKDNKFQIPLFLEKLILNKSPTFLFGALALYLFCIDSNCASK